LVEQLRDVEADKIISVKEGSATPPPP
jgi:hypothetical protein